MKMLDNFKINEGTAVIKVNPKVYSLETVYSAAYVFLDKAYIVLDGDPKKEIIVKLKAKGKESLEILGNEFLNELINYSDYQQRAGQTKEIREMLLQRALFTNDPSLIKEDNPPEENFDGLGGGLDEGSCLDDPEGIAIPWEDKYESKAKKEEARHGEDNPE
jgi:His-Xaa-Ser system protein HxsD